MAWQEVIACNIAHTPLDDASMNAVVLCLALMGTDYGAFLREVRTAPAHAPSTGRSVNTSTYGARCTRHRIAWCPQAALKLRGMTATSPRRRLSHLTRGYVIANAAGAPRIGTGWVSVDRGGAQPHRERGRRRERCDQGAASRAQGARSNTAFQCAWHGCVCGHQTTADGLSLFLELREIHWLWTSCMARSAEDGVQVRGAQFFQ
jgi:hypothetical protein